MVFLISRKAIDGSCYMEIDGRTIRKRDLMLVQNQFYAIDNLLWCDVAHAGIVTS